VSIDIITNTPYDKCIERKRDAHIIIDECKTGSFHKCTIEGLNLGSVVFVNISDKINEVHKKKYKRLLPVHNCTIENLESNMIELINKGKKYIEDEALKSREYFLSYWSNKIICQEYDNIYNNLLTNIIKSSLDINKITTNWRLLVTLAHLS
jgi:hypothetical protein